MNMMENCFTQGSEYGHQPGPPVNEDYVILVEIDAVNSETGIATAHKIWDEAGSPKSFYAKLVWPGLVGTPTTNILAVGQVTLFYRCGDYNSSGSTAPEFHEESASNFSWLCFVETRVLQIEDLGEGTGKECYYDASGTIAYPADSETLALVAMDTSYHEDTPPWKTGRVYWGVKLQGTVNPYYLCFLPGFGDEATTFDVVVDATTYSIAVDGAGHVLDFTAT